jgi:hypothetical protein
MIRQKGKEIFIKSTLTLYMQKCTQTKKLKLHIHFLLTHALSDIQSKLTYRLQWKRKTALDIKPLFRLHIKKWYLFLKCALLALLAYEIQGQNKYRIYIAYYCFVFFTHAHCNVFDAI